MLTDESVMQMGAGVQVDKLYFNVWGSMDLTKHSNDEEMEFTEFDYSIDYTDTLTEGIDYSLGLIYYSFPSANNTMEVYGGLSFDTVLSPSITVYYDFDEINSTYVSAGIGQSFEVADGVALDCSASLGWGSKGYTADYWGTADGDSAMQDLTVSLAMPIELGSWTLTPSVTYVSLIDGAVRDTNSYDDAADYIYAGIGLSTTF